MSDAARFATTHWSLVVAAGADTSPDSRAALATLCEAYWYPLYAFVRRRGSDAHEAQDLTQAFFAKLLEKDYLRDVDRDRGRFRSFLITAFRHFVSKERAAARALKRGGGRKALSLDFEDGERRYRLEPATHVTPDKVYERRWALTLLDRVLDGLRQALAARGKEPVFDALKGFLTGGESRSYREIGVELGMTEGAVKVAVHRLRSRYRDALRAEITRTVAGPDEVDEEIRHLLEALAGG